MSNECYYCGQPTDRGYCPDCGSVPADLVRFGRQIGMPSQSGARAMTDAEIAEAAAYKAARLAEDPNYSPEMDW